MIQPIFTKLKKLALWHPNRVMIRHGPEHNVTSAPRQRIGKRRGNGYHGAMHRRYLTSFDTRVLPQETVGVLVDRYRRVRGRDVCVVLGV